MVACSYPSATRTIIPQRKVCDRLLLKLHAVKEDFYNYLPVSLTRCACVRKNNLRREDQQLFIESALLRCHLGLGLVENFLVFCSRIFSSSSTFLAALPTPSCLTQTWKALLPNILFSRIVISGAKIDGQRWLRSGTQFQLATKRLWDQISAKAFLLIVHWTSHSRIG